MNKASERARTIHWTRCTRCGQLWRESDMRGGVCWACRRAEREDKLARLREEIERATSKPAETDDG